MLRLPGSRLALALLAISCPLASRVAQAQLAPPTVPKGLLRIEGFAGLSTWDRRFSMGEDQPLAQDFVREHLGSDFFSPLIPMDALIQRVSGISDARLDLGRSSARQMVTVGRSGLGLAYGITDRVTIFGRIPFVRVKVRANLALDPADATAGFNPADPVFGTPAGAGQSQIFFQAFDAALTELSDSIAAGAYLDPNTRTLAEQTLLTGQSLRNDLFNLISGSSPSPFLPTASSAAGAAILARIGALQGTLSGPLLVPGFTQSPTLPAAPLSDAAFQSFLTSPSGPIAGTLETPVLNTVGDMEAGLAVSIVQRLDESVRARGFRVAAQALVRFPTGQAERPEAFFDVGTGERQPDVELSLLADVVRPRGGARLEAGYNLQLARAIERRIAPPSEPTPYASRTAPVSRNPGDVLSLAVTPYLRLAPTFALFGGVRYSDRGRDAVKLVQGVEPIPEAPVTLLEEESDASWLEWNAGISYRSPLIRRDERTRMPFDASVTVSGVASGSGGRVPRPVTVRALLRLYRPFF